MKKYLLALFLLVPIVGHADCQCDDEEVDENAPYSQYSYMGVKGGNSDYGVAAYQGISKSIGAYYGHRYSKYFAVEGEYTFIGTFNDPVNMVSGHATALSIAALHHIDLSNTMSLYGKIGVAHTINKMTPGGGGSVNDAALGFGFDFRISPEWMMRLANDYYKVAHPARARAIHTHIGFAYRF